MARAFNGSTDYLRRLTPTIGSLPFSVAVWFIPPPLGTILTDQTLWVQCNAAATVFFKLLLEGSTVPDRGKLRWAVRSGTTTNAQSTGFVVPGQWNHAVGVEETTSLRHVYLNGTDTNTNVVLRDGLSSPNDRTCVGAQAAAAVVDLFDGIEAHVAVWQAALSAAEVLSLYRGCSPLRIQRQALLSYGPCNGQNPEAEIVIPRVNFNVFGNPAIVEEPPTPLPHILAA